MWWSGLRKTGWTVYQEVMFIHLADIVAVKAETVWVIEAKLHFNLKVLEQAHRWHGVATIASVATPSWSGKQGHGFGREVCKRFGLGAIIATPHRYVAELLKPEPGEPHPKFLGSLVPEQQDYAKAGTNAGHWTPFKGFARDLAAYVAANPGVSVKVAEEAPKVKDYYGRKYAFRRNVPPLCQRGAIPGVEARYDIAAEVFRLWPCRDDDEPADGGPAPVARVGSLRSRVLGLQP